MWADSFSWTPACRLSHDKTCCSSELTLPACSAADIWIIMKSVTRRSDRAPTRLHVSPASEGRGGVDSRSDCVLKWAVFWTEFGLRQLSRPDECVAEHTQFSCRCWLVCLATSWAEEQTIRPHSPPRTNWRTSEHVNWCFLDQNQRPHRKLWCFICCSGFGFHSYRKVWGPGVWKLCCCVFFLMIMHIKKKSQNVENEVDSSGASNTVRGAADSHESGPSLQTYRM